MKLLSIIFILTFTFTFTFTKIQASEVVEKSSAKAFNSKGQLLYIEQHEITSKGGKLSRLHTQYYTHKGMNIGKIESDFTKNPYTPIYFSDDIRFDRQEGIKYENNEWIAFAKKDQKSKTIELKFKLENDLVAGQGLHFFIQSKLNELIESSKPTKIKFLIPMNQDFYEFQIKVLKKTKELVTFRVQFNSWLLRMVAPHIDTTYEISTRRLITYEGPSNLLSDKQQSQNVVIHYTYP